MWNRRSSGYSCTVVGLTSAAPPEMWGGSWWSGAYQECSGRVVSSGCTTCLVRRLWRAGLSPARASQAGARSELAGTWAPPWPGGSKETSGQTRREKSDQVGRDRVEGKKTEVDESNKCWHHVLSCNWALNVTCTNGLAEIQVAYSKGLWWHFQLKS